MNKKHIALIVVGICIVLLIQLTLWVRGSMNKMQKEAAAAAASEAAAVTQLMGEQVQLAALQRQSSDLITFLQTWQPHFQTIDTPQSAEVNLAMRVRESNLVNLSQRFEQAGVKGNASLPSVMKAYLTFEDDYARLMNWLGKLETEMPTLRVSNLKLTKGTRANELRMEVTLEHPLPRK